MPTSPLVTVLLAVHDGERFLRLAVESVLRQTMSDLELVVVDDASTDATGAILEGVGDERLRVLRNDEQLGLAGSLNRGLEDARGRYVARLDADDVAVPVRLERQLEFLAREPGCAVVGSGVLELDEANRPGRLHLMPADAVSVRFVSLFTAPFFHPTTLVDRAALGAELRYDTEFAESEDYELWARALDRFAGANVEEALVLYRVHAGQASQRRRDLQRDLQLRVALHALERVAADMTVEQLELAWLVGAREPVPPEAVEDARDAFLAVYEEFQRRFGPGASPVAARRLVHLARRSGGAPRARVMTAALRLDPALVGHETTLRRTRRALERSAREAAGDWLSRLAPQAERPIRVTAVFPEPTPYRTPLLDRVAALPEIDLTVVYSSESVVGRSWKAEGEHRSIVLEGRRLPGADRLVRHEYPFTPGVLRVLRESAPDVVVASGWSTFAAQAAIAWCRARRIPYLLVVESHDEGPRAGWRRAVKGTVVPTVVRGASGVLVTGTLARQSMLARGAPHERVRVFANTIDVDAFEHYAERLAGRRHELREALGAEPDDVLVLSVGRLASEKRYDLLVRAAAASGCDDLTLALVGDGPEREALETLAAELDVRLTTTGDWPWERVVEAYVAADVFALLSERETWGVVVNEAAACGLPLVLSDRVGAAHDLLRDGENGTLVPAGDVEAAAVALRALARDPERRRAAGARSREVARDWGYGPSVEGFVAAVREAAGRIV